MTSIRNRIVIFAVLATLIPAAGFGLLSFWRYQALVMDNVAQQLRVLAHYANSELAQWQKERIDEVRALSASSRLSDGLLAIKTPVTGTSRVAGYELGLYLRSVETKLPAILELTITDASGTVVASSASAPAAIALPADWQNWLLRQGIVVQPPQWDAARGKATELILAPMQSTDGALIGTLAALIDVGMLGQTLQGVARVPALDVIVLTQQGQPLFSLRRAGGALTPVSDSVMQQLRDDPGQPRTFAGHRGREVVGVAEIASAAPVLIVAERDESEAYAAWRHLLLLYLFLVTCLVLLVAVLAYRFGRSIVTPLNRLLRAADGIAGGNLGVQLRVERSDEIGELTRQFNRMTNNLQKSRTEIDAANETLQEQNRLLETLSARDGLTGLYNRKKLDEILTDQLARFRRTGRAFSVLMLDIDNFKHINDRKGHLAGDEVLSQVAATLVHSIRAIDYAARFGGEEFVLLLVETDIDGAFDIAQRVRRVIETHRVGEQGDAMPITISIGVTEITHEDHSPDELLARADRALYQAKRAGRNTVRRAA